MSKKQNPYHLWLGLPVELVSPDFFQLLGIPPNATDDQKIAAAARARAQKLLDALKNVPIKNESEQTIQEKLKSRIVTAHKTISDPAKRKQYAAALATKRAGASSTSMLEPPKPPAETPPVTPAPPSSNANSNIPQAIPLAMPLDSQPQQVVATPPEAGQFDSLSDEDIVRVRPVRARGKRSSIVPIVVTLLITSVIGGLVSLLTKYNNVFDVLAKRDQDVATSSVNTVNDQDRVPLESVDVPDANADPEPLQVPENFQAISNAQAQAMGSASTGNKLSEPPPPVKETGGSGTTKMTTETVEKTATMFEEEATPPSKDGPEASPAEKAASESVARVAANMVRQALLRRDIPAAKAANQRVESLIEGFGLPDQSIQTSLEKNHATNEQMIGHLEVFLAQLQSAAVEMPGGQDIKVGKLVMSLVDAGPKEVTLRRAGGNDVVPYTDLPLSVAIALGDQGAKKSVPKWNMAKAAALTIHSRYNPALLERADPLLKQCLSDGYNKECKTISSYSLDLWQTQHLPATLPADPTLDEVSALLKDFRADNGYKNPNRVKPDSVGDLLETLLIELPESPEQRRAHLSEAIAVAAVDKRFDALLSATDELYRLSNPTNVADTVVKPINRSMRSDMTNDQARHLIHTVIGLTKQLDGREGFDQKSKDKLISHAQTLVEEFSFSELAPKVKQLAKQ